MATFTWTPEQQTAIATVDRNVVVSAAAGSGKTAVLAARCAYLVCDAPPPHRCDVDRLLVVTFTEAAAAEMKQRIHKAIRQRGAESPDDPRPRAQAALVDAAQISTLHGFCLWMVRRWFHRAGVDATAQLLDEGEAHLLRRDVLDALFNELYAAEKAMGDSFRRLVEDYGLGHDGEIAAYTLRLAAFLTSLPEPGAWLAMARDASAPRLAAILDATKTALRREVARQAEMCGEIAAHIRRDLPAGAFYGDLVSGYADGLCHWRDALDRGGDWDIVRAEISAVQLSSKGSPRMSKNVTEEELHQRDRARDMFNDVKVKLLEKRLKGPLCRFSAEQIVRGISHIQPYVCTLADLAAEFARRYDHAKRAMGVMDFSDLERKAYELLTASGDGIRPNPVAAELRERFAHVLVDEFQDINPLQARLLSLVSREADDGRPGNLFTVGDVKQSIYRFRLAEPAMFLHREGAYRADGVAGVCVDLQRNYRSRRVILDGVNEIFRRLMQAECGGIAYDEHAELKPPDPDAPPGEPIELHILERGVRPDDSDNEDENADSADSAESADEEPRFVDASDPTQWRAVEREAFLIAARIRRMLRDGVTVADRGVEHPLRYRDICVLLRSTRHSAAPLADMLGQMGIPAWTDATGDLLAAREVCDVLSLLALLDNLQQDIPLAAVLRSGVLGDRLDEDDLVEVRVFDREGAFHEAVRGYAQRGANDTRRHKLAAMLGIMDRYRQEARLRPLADVLWMIYRETGYLAYVGGLRGGEQRRANLITLHERARQFGQFRRQGLRRFLNFIESAQAESEELGSPSAIGEADDVVRIMSIHKSKGLEFPIVFCAELGRAFNLGDARGRFLFDREVGIGLKVVDPERLIEYPTALHQWCARSSHEAAIAEELRVWYVAMTRAQERLILVGTENLDAVERHRSATGGDADRLNPLTVLTARSPMQWVVPALGLMSPGKLAWNQPPPPGALVAATTHAASAIQRWTLPQTVTKDVEPVRRAVASFAPLPGSEPLSGEATQAEEIIGRLDFVYPYLALSSVPAARAASEAKRAHPDAADGEEQAPIVRQLEAFSPIGRGDADSAAHRGQVVHTALQFIRLDRTANERDIAAEIDRLRVENIIAEDDVPLIDTSALEWFHNSALGKRIRAGADRYHREWMFLAAEPPELFDPTVTGGEADRVLVRGVVDGILAADAGVEIVDFKTDRVPPEGVEARALAYATQMRLYTAAVERVFGPVTNCHLVFLHSRRIVEVEGIPS